MSMILLYLAILPSIVLGVFVWWKDRVEKEPFGLLALLFAGGLGSIIVTLIVSFFGMIFCPPLFSMETDNLILLFLQAFIGVALVEESSKWLFLWLITWKNKEFTHIYDAIVYAVFVSLGFATLENILYVFQGGLGTALMRAVLSVPMHAFCGVFMGYYYGLAKQTQINNRQDLVGKNIFLSIFVPMLLHGFFDFCLFTENVLFTGIFFVFVVILYVIAFMKIAQLSKIRLAMKPTFCTNCGNRVTDKYCSRCGHKAI